MAIRLIDLVLVLDLPAVRLKPVGLDFEHVILLSEHCPAVHHCFGLLFEGTDGVPRGDGGADCEGGRCYRDEERRAREGHGAKRTRRTIVMEG